VRERERERERKDGHVWGRRSEGKSSQET